jgi:hypothetical protein
MKKVYMIDLNYEYEVAFSFLQNNEKLAYEISDLIQDRFSTFIYSEHQKELAGTDGEKTFNDVFQNKARIVVVLYCDDWGKTKWTRVEETAIRNRGHEEGYDFTLFVQLDPNSNMPKWLPRNRIYYDFERWGSKGLAPVIEAKIQEFWGASRPESLVDQKEKIKRAFQLQQEQKKYLNSNEGYAEAQLEFNRLYSLLDLNTEQLEDPEISLNFGYEKHPRKEFVARCENYSVRFSWKYAYSNTLDGSNLYVAIGFSDIQGDQAFYERHPDSMNALEKAIQFKEYNFDYNPVSSELGWSEKKEDSSFLTSEQLMNE